MVDQGNANHAPPFTFYIYIYIYICIMLLQISTNILKRWPISTVPWRHLKCFMLRRKWHSWYFAVHLLPTRFTWSSLITGKPYRMVSAVPWWRHQTETFSALLALCAGNSLVTGEFPSQRPVTRSFDFFFDMCLNKQLSIQSWCWWFETPSHPLWRHTVMNHWFLNCVKH